jgi:hypothetical protein
LSICIATSKRLTINRWATPRPLGLSQILCKQQTSEQNRAE